MVDGWLMVDGWSREGIPRGSFGPVREVGFLDLPQEGVGVGDRHDMQTFRLPD